MSGDDRRSTWGEDVLSRTQLLDQGARAASALSGYGVRYGDHVAVMLPMCLESVVATLACIQLGAVRVTLPVSGEMAYARERIRGARPPVVVAAGSCRLDGRRYHVKAMLDRALRDCPSVRHVLVVSQLPRPLPWTPGRDHWWHEALSTKAAPLPSCGLPTTLPRPWASPGPRPRAPYSEGMTSEGTNGPAPEAARPRPDTAALVFDDPLARRSRDDTDQGWGETPASGGADLARFLDEKPPHHL